MLKLKHNPTLKDFQEYVNKLEIERGFIKDTLLEKCLHLGEEVGELNRAIRRKFKKSEIGDELTDIIIILCTIANRLDIDLEKAFRKKEKINKKRIWN